eukprot:gb/GECG01011026.1/.p1 GENE.gb/GECG01011026.1/~~gb/GECG01011026.1/.p1  ORF type:complete len:335 (+),score=37.42 gb/GECG01011026.1/:1-1005(+)
MQQQQRPHHPHHDPCAGTTANRLFGYSSFREESVVDPTETVLTVGGNSSSPKKHGGWITTYLNAGQEEGVQSATTTSSLLAPPQEMAAKGSPNRRQNNELSGGTTNMRRPGNPHASELEGFSRINIGSVYSGARTSGKRDRETGSVQTSSTKERRTNRQSPDGTPHSYSVNALYEPSVKMFKWRSSSVPKNWTASTQSPPLLSLRNPGSNPSELSLGLTKPAGVRPAFRVDNPRQSHDSFSESPRRKRDTPVGKDPAAQVMSPVSDSSVIGHGPHGDNTDSGNTPGDLPSPRRSVKRRRDSDRCLRHQLSRVSVSEGETFPETEEKSGYHSPLT